MKKIMMTLAAVVCCAMISTVFTSCSKDDSDSNDFYYYRANGSISGTGGLGGLFDRVGSWYRTHQAGRPEGNPGL